jgi:hypothetical protein
MAEAAQALLATPARGDPRERYRLTGLQGHTRPDLLHHPGALVAQHGGAPRWRGAVDRVEVRVAHAAGVQPDEHLSRLWRRELDLGDLEPGGGLVQDSGAQRGH